MPCQHKSNDWDPEGGSFFVCADCGMVSYDCTDWTPPYEPPDWDSEPWANSHGLCMIEGDAFYGQWCYMSTARPWGFFHVETRPTDKPADPSDPAGWVGTTIARHEITPTRRIMSDIKFVGRVHKVNFNQRDDKHTVAFARRAQLATEAPLLGLANPGNIKAQSGATKGEVIEKLRLDLVRDIEAIGGDPQDFDFNAAITEVKDGAFWSAFMEVYGTRLRIHKTNEGW